MNQRLFTYKRVTVDTGKHGVGDMKVAIAGVAPTHGELGVMLAAILRAERRYSSKHYDGAWLLWNAVQTHEPLFVSKDWDLVREFAESLDDKGRNGGG